MLASIIIPCYNQAQFLAEAIESAINQTIPCEVIVVNDGSPDNTSEVASNYPVKLIEQPNRGICNARNNGIKASSGKYILTLDSDDWIDNNFIEKTSAVMEEADIVGTGQWEFGLKRNIYFPIQDPTEELFRVFNRINVTSLQKREVWETLNGYDEDFKDGYEDWEYWIRATKAGFKVKTIPDPIFHYRIHGNSLSDKGFRGNPEKHKELYAKMMKKIYAI